MSCQWWRSKPRWPILTYSFLVLVRLIHRFVYENQKLQMIDFRFFAPKEIFHSLPRCARSEMSNLFDQFVTPRDSFFWISSTNSGRLTTQPFPRKIQSNSSRSFTLDSINTDDIHTVLQMKARWKHMEIIFNSVNNDTMSSIISSLEERERESGNDRSMRERIYLTSTNNIGFRC